MGLLLLVGVVAFVVAPAAVWARPGGGGSYRGGSSGGSRSSGGGSRGSGGGYSGGGYSSGGGSLGFEMVALLVVVGVVVVYFAFKRGALASHSSARDAILEQQFGETAAVTRSVSLDALRARDPALTEADILKRVFEMARILRETWTAGDMRPARAFMSDGVFSRYQVQLALMTQEGLRNVMTDAQVLYSTLEAVESEPPFDVIHVRFTGQARDRMVPIASTPDQIAQALRSAPLEQYTEIWSLVRRHGAVTKTDPAQIGRVCPSCGAPLTGGEVIKCAYCKALVCSGEYDWVLAEITQIAEWHPSSRAVDGLDALRGDDPAVAREVLEDRGSYLFWKWVQAAREGTFAKLRKCATAQLAASAGQMSGGLARARDVAVGGADLLSVDPGSGEGEGDPDYAYVKIYWSAAFQPGQEPTPVQSILRLSRRSGTQSVASMTALVCRACGAPLTESDTPRCDHCNAEIADGAQSWVLDAVLPPGAVFSRRAPSPEPQIPEWLLPNIADPRERMMLFAQMAGIIASDGQISRSERRLLRLCAQRWSIPDETVTQLLTHPDPGARHVASASPQWFLSGLVSAALIDGKVDPSERALLERACRELALPPEELERQLAACQARMRGQGAASV